MRTRGRAQRAHQGKCRLSCRGTGAPLPSAGTPARRRLRVSWGRGGGENPRTDSGHWRTKGPRAEVLQVRKY